MKTLLLTGATGGLGRYICKYFYENFNLILTDSDDTSLYKLVKSLNKSNSRSKIYYYAVDLSKIDELKIFVQKITKQFNSIDVLINNAAVTGTNKISNYSKNLKTQSYDTFVHALKVNLAAPFFLSQQFKPLLAKSDSASIINISSLFGVITSNPTIYRDLDMESPAAYETSKSGLIQLTKYLAVRMAPNIRVNAIAPGGISRNQDPKFISRYIKETPLGRMATEEDVCGAINWLTSESSNFVTGQTIMLDGGRSIW